MQGKPYEFTEEQIHYILSHWGKESAHSMKQKFGCSWNAICKVAEKNGLQLPTSMNWTEEEVETLRILSSQLNYKRIAEMMHRSENAVYIKARRLGIPLIQSRRSWTEEEEQQLKSMWGTKSIEKIAKDLKRTVFSLKVKAVRMHLGSMIENNCDVVSITELSELVQVPRDRITGTWVELGLKIKSKRLTAKKTYYVVTLEEMMRFLKENPNEWDARNVDPYTLGAEPEWLVEKRERDRKENPLWYRKWTKEDIKQAETLFRFKKSYEEIAQLLNRSKGAVERVLRELGYSYRLPRFWTGEELKFLKDHYEEMTSKEIAEQFGRTESAVQAKKEELGYQKRKRRDRNE